MKTTFVERERFWCFWLSVVGSLLIAYFVAWFSARPVVIYGVIVDAGSTGTRVNVGKFEVKRDGQLKLKKFRFVEVGEGLTTATDLDSLLNELLGVAKEEVPNEFIESTQIYMGATAGLRLVGEERSNALLDRCRAALRKSGFTFEDHFVFIMEGEDEGVFAWATVNELLLANGNVGTVDLGGGSVQVTFAVNDHKSATRVLRASGKRIPVASHSHLGYGMKEFRQELHHKLYESGDLDSNPCLERGNAQIVRVGANLESHETIGNGDFEACVELMISAFDFRLPGSDEVCKPEENRCFLQGVDKPAPTGKFIAFAYFYDTIVGKAGLSSTASLSEIYERGILACSAMDDPCPCGDLAYVYVLLKYGLKLESDEVELHFQQHIDGKMIGWAVGALLNYLQR
uniref:Uncharacterized protein n=1 Tax=Rhodosorus marinus TaxID=101924 RepID=A0A7S3A475_9RHOD|mmetsp:Transcript_44259/g.172295  ORF Transcript_44259/g.172295 Transcript_44259/m.172295 type:complete len:401 (+) Transcript_44259:244-1446(+)